MYVVMILIKDPFQIDLFAATSDLFKVKTISRGDTDHVMSGQ